MICPTSNAKDSTVRTLTVVLSLSLLALPLAAQKKPHAPPPAPAAAPAVWRTSIGTSAGFVDIHPVGNGGDITALMLPGWGAALGAFGLPTPTMPSLYMILPIGGKFAFEPGADIHRVQTQGNTTFASDLSARVDYAFTGGWYGAFGVSSLILKSTGSPTFGVLGATLAGGYRFHLAGAWSSRFEISHTIMAKQHTAGQPPLTVTAFSFGAMVGLR